MTEPPIFALPNPWAFHDWSGPEGFRRRKLGGEPVAIPAAGPLLIAAPAAASLSAGGRRRGIQRETAPFALMDGDYALSMVSVGTRPDERRLAVSRAGALLGEIVLEGLMPRPGWTGGRGGRAPDSERGEALDRFIELTIERIRAGEGADPGQQAWDCLAAAWTRGQATVREPPRALIVRHAERLRAIVADLAARPRRLLRRHHDMIRVERTQQLDASCIRWLSRQPGRDVFERAGPRQRILAIAREETVNTLENRVLRDFVERSKELARSYLSRYRHLSTSQRWKLVSQYGTECARIARELEARGVERATPPVVPNYALLRERRYRTLWRAYRELLKNLDDQDESWRWQHRLWADFCRLAVHVVLRQAAGRNGVIAESPLRVSPEQMRGRWSLLGQQSGVFLLSSQGREFVVSLLADFGAPHAKASPWIASLGALAALHVQALDNACEARILIWPMHEVGEKETSLETMAQSADRALRECLRDVRRHYDRDERAGGLIIASLVAGPPIGTPSSRLVRCGNIRAVRLSPEAPALATGLERIGRVVAALCEELTRQ